MLLTIGMKFAIYDIDLRRVTYDLEYLDINNKVLYTQIR